MVPGVFRSELIHDSYVDTPGQAETMEIQLMEGCAGTLEELRTAARNLAG